MEGILYSELIMQDKFRLYPFVCYFIVQNFMQVDCFIEDHSCCVYYIGIKIISESNLAVNMYTPGRDFLVEGALLYCRDCCHAHYSSNACAETSVLW